MISYGGILLADPTPEVLARIESTLSLGDVLEFERQARPDLFAAHWPFPGRRPADRVTLNVMHWPFRASRWAMGHFLVDGESLDAIRAQGGPLAFTMATPADGSVAMSLYALPARPLAQAIGEVDGRTLYLLTLVDDRYYWWQRTAQIEVVVPPETPTTWADLYYEIGLALGKTITADTVDAAYLSPPQDFATRYQYLPLLLDAVAASCGQRVVVRYDGTVEAINVATGLARMDAQATAAANKFGGGNFALN